MIVTLFITLLICLNFYKKLLLLFLFFITAIILFYSLEINSSLFIRLFEDFGSFESRLKMFFDVSLSIKEGYFDSDLTAGQVFSGYFFIPLHIINYFVIRGSKNTWLLVFLFQEWLV